MFEEKYVENVLRHILRAFLDEVRKELERFADALSLWVNELLARRLPPDWRAQMHAFFDAQEQEGFEVDPRYRRVLENYIAAWGKARGILPEPVVTPRAESGRPGVDAAGDARAFIESQSQAPALSLSHPALFPDPTREATLPPEMKRARKVVRIEKVQGIGGWYDEALATGQYRPSFGRRVALAVVRSLFPDSEPTQVITYDDGTVEIILGGGPTSGAMGEQATAVGTFGLAASKGTLLKEVVQTVVDATVQEATDLPVGPSVVQSATGGRLGSVATRAHVRAVSMTLEERGWTITGGGGVRAEEYLPGPGGRKGAAYPDITAEKEGRIVRINTVDTLVDGTTPDSRERRGAAKIRQLKPGEHLLLIPKPLDE